MMSSKSTEPKLQPSERRLRYDEDLLHRITSAGPAFLSQDFDNPAIDGAFAEFQGGHTLEGVLSYLSAFRGFLPRLTQDDLSTIVFKVKPSKADPIVPLLTHIP
jgi:hypothetical protein